MGRIDEWIANTWWAAVAGGEPVETRSSVKKQKASHSTRSRGFTEEMIKSFSDSHLDGGEWMSAMEKPMVKE